MMVGQDDSVTERPAGRQFYSPTALAVHSVISLPVGMFLYGLNVRRRGGRVMGSLLAVLSAILFVGAVGLAVTGGGLSGMGVLGVIVAIAVFRMESPHYDREMLNRATKAKWWPPALWVLAIIILFSILMMFVAPGEALE